MLRPGMGHTLWIEARGRPGSETHEDMSVLLRLKERLDSLSEKLGVPKLSGFYDYTELARFHPDGDSVCVPTWFDSAKGLLAVTTLRSLLETDFAALEWVRREFRLVLVP